MAVETKLESRDAEALGRWLLLVALRLLALGHAVFAMFLVCLAGLGVLALAWFDEFLTSELSSVQGATSEAVRAALVMESLKTSECVTAVSLTFGGLLVGAGAAAFVYARARRMLRGAGRLSSAGSTWALGLLSYCGFALARINALAYPWGQHFELFDDSALWRVASGARETLRDILQLATLGGGLAVAVAATMALSLRRHAAPRLGAGVTRRATESP